MREQYTDFVIPTLAQHLGVAAKEIAPSHDLYRDWGLTPLSLVVILLDLERIAAIELPSHELSNVRTVSDLSNQVRGWVRTNTPDLGAFNRRRARRSRHALRERRIRRELHYLRWLEQKERAASLARPRQIARSLP
jgi:acyl carrier protein